MKKINYGQEYNLLDLLQQALKVASNTQRSYNNANSRTFVSQSVELSNTISKIKKTIKARHRRLHG